MNKIEKIIFKKTNRKKLTLKYLIDEFKDDNVLIIKIYLTFMIIIIFIIAVANSYN